MELRDICHAAMKKHHLTQNGLAERIAAGVMTGVCTLAILPAKIAENYIDILVIPVFRSGKRRAISMA
jgi:hypothetical protein